MTGGCYRSQPGHTSLLNQLFHLLLLAQACNAAKMMMVTLFDESMQGWWHGRWQQWWQQHVGQHVLGACIVRANGNSKEKLCM